MTTNCGTCKLAKWQRTPTGRIKRGEPGVCLYKFPPSPTMPWSVSARVFHWPPSKTSVWPNDGGGCQTWVAMEEAGEQSMGALEKLVAACEQEFIGETCLDEPDDEPISVGVDLHSGERRASTITFGMIRRAHAALITERGGDS